MTDNSIKSWIEERRAIHAKAGAGRWEKRLNGHNYEIWEPGEFDDAPVSSNSAKPDSTAIVDAHNMFPRALDALNAVLEVLDAGVRDGDDAEIERNIALSEIAEALEEVTM